MLNLIVGFVLGATAIIVAEALCLLLLLSRLLKSKSDSKSEESSNNNNIKELDHHQSLTFSYNKQGTVWALEPDKIPNVVSEDKAPKEQKSRKEILEVFPVKKHAKLDEHSLILTDPDGSQVTIHLSGCTVLAVSATHLSARKWAKRYPIRIESRNLMIYKGSRACHLYFETSWEKESWCKALRLASSVNKERINWYAMLNEEFHGYLTSLKAGYPSFMKPSAGLFCEPADRSLKTDASSSKVRLFLKKLAKKASKSGLDNKAGTVSVSPTEDKKLGERSRSFQDLYASGSTKTISAEKTTHNPLGENMDLPFPSSLTQSRSQGQVSVISDAESDEKFSIDEGTLCWNMLISRLFFDAKRNTDMKSSIQERIQRTLSNMRTPSYIGGVTCTNLDVGILPPYIHSMRVLPTDMNEVWAMEIDIEYSGGAILDIETRLEIQEADFEKGIVNASMDPSSVDEVTSDLLEGFEHFGKQLNLEGKIANDTEKRDEGDTKFDAMKKSNSWRSSYTSRWKCIVNSIANHVSQVPISLGIKVASVRGTLRLHIKPPPSDQLWFGFTTMPEIDLNLQSSLGDHKISNTHVALLLENRLKTAIRETLVLPNCENVYIPWMLAEKDDWTPRRTAPFIRMMPTTAANANNQEAAAVAGASDPLHQAPTGPEEKSAPTPQEQDPSLNTQQKLQDLKTPLLLTSTSVAAGDRSVESDADDVVSSSASLTRESENGSSSSSSLQSGREDDKGNSKRFTLNKTRMMGLGKKMSEKLEEKRRHIEEKSRHIVDKMRGPPPPQ